MEVYFLMSNNKKGIIHVNREGISPVLVKRNVDYMLSRDVPTKPFDFLFRRNLNSVPHAFHKAYGLPGIFESVALTDVFPDKGGDISQADSLINVLPDNETLSRKSSILLEQETGFISDDKIDKTYEYYLDFVIKLKKHCIPYIATNYDYDVYELKKKIDNFNFTVNLLVYNPEKISEILNMLKDKNYHKEEFTIDDYALALQCLIHARKPYAEDVIVDLVNIFQSIDYISPNCQNELSSSLIVAIKYHFKDDIEKSRRLITMIVKAMDKGGFGEL